MTEFDLTELMDAQCCRAAARDVRGKLDGARSEGGKRRRVGLLARTWRSTGWRSAGKLGSVGGEVGTVRRRCVRTIAAKLADEMPGRGRSVGRGAEPKARERTPAECISCSREKRAETLLAEGEVSRGGEEEVVDVTMGSPGLVFGNEDEEGGKVV
jgi:hypothetical protein